MPPAELEGLVHRVFGERVGLAQRYVDHLVTTGVEHGLVGPREVDRLWERHVLNCAAVALLCPGSGEVVDVGSGAGLPGLVLALARPDLPVALVEPLLRRVSWLEHVVDDLGLAAQGVRVVRARAEGSGLRAATVTARAVAPLDRLAGWCLPLLEPGGRLLALKGRSAADELAAAEPVLRRLGAVAWEVLEVAPDGGRQGDDAAARGLTATVVRVTVSPVRRDGATGARGTGGTSAAARSAGGVRSSRKDQVPERDRRSGRARSPRPDRGPRRTAGTTDVGDGRRGDRAGGQGGDRRGDQDGDRGGQGRGQGW